MKADETGAAEAARPVILRLKTDEFQHRVLDNLARLEVKINMIVGNGQPGRMKLAEDRLVALERDDLRRNIYDRIVIAVITFAITFGISAFIAWRSCLK